MCKAPRIHKMTLMFVEQLILESRFPKRIEHLVFQHVLGFEVLRVKLSLPTNCYTVWCCPLPSPFCTSRHTFEVWPPLHKSGD